MKWYFKIFEPFYQALKNAWWYYTEASRLRKFKNKHLGEDCFIIGNGPSLNKMDLEKLNDFHTFGLNKIFMIFKRAPLKISYLVCVNSLAIEQCYEDFENFKSPVFLSHKASKGIVKKKNHIHKLLTTGGISWLFSETIEKPIYEGVTVTFVAMQLAYYMGFRRVFLVGVDHNFKQSGNPHEKQKMEGDDPNHFDPDYFKGMHWHLADLKGSEVSYALADYAFQRTGRKIFDATVDGKLQVFEKIPLEEALKMAKKKK
ncbi:MAG: DUF115 domain-containing protein [Bacteroidetes bacterium]|jgi:hypothetical protein|nr:DUF115 domain-containing protein [Bacteroidota bacterium]MDF1865964.1 DUF115 domain-containing protein [Saprospiraceae bacterium]